MGSTNRLGAVYRSLNFFCSYKSWPRIFLFFFFKQKVKTFWIIPKIPCSLSTVTVMQLSPWFLCYSGLPLRNLAEVSSRCVLSWLWDVFAILASLLSLSLYCHMAAIMPLSPLTPRTSLRVFPVYFLSFFISCEKVEGADVTVWNASELSARCPAASDGVQQGCDGEQHDHVLQSGVTKSLTLANNIAWECLFQISQSILAFVFSSCVPFRSVSFCCVCKSLLCLRGIVSFLLVMQLFSLPQFFSLFFFALGHKFLFVCCS